MRLRHARSGSLAVRIGRLGAVPGRRIGGWSSARPAVADVRGERRMQHLDGLQPERFDAVEDPLAGSEQDWGDVERELVDDPGDERLPNGGGAARDVYAVVAGRLTRMCVGGVEA